MEELVEAKKRVLAAKASVDYIQMTNVFDKTPEELVKLDLKASVASKEYTAAVLEYERRLEQNA